MNSNCNPQLNEHSTIQIYPFGAETQIFWDNWSLSWLLMPWWLCQQGISNHGIDQAWGRFELPAPILSWVADALVTVSTGHPQPCYWSSTRKIWTPCTNSVLRNDKKNQHIFMFHEVNLAADGLILNKNHGYHHTPLNVWIESNFVLSNNSQCHMTDLQTRTVTPNTLCLFSVTTSSW